MSCTIIAVPFLLYKVVGLVSAATVVATAANELASDKMTRDIEPNTTCEDVEVITAKHFIEKSFETVFMDEDLLIKTLEEHGVMNIKHGESWEKGKITGQVDTYTLNFEKPAEDKPYVLTITCIDTDNAEEKIQDLSNEYALNVQEETYLSIINKLKDNNLELEDEEVLDDNTIVLTVNID